MTEKQSCMYCKFFEYKELLESGCLRYPPTLIPPSDLYNASSMFPQVKSNWWCGEWKAED